jgi:acyl-CoA thioesterase FadM
MYLWIRLARVLVNARYGQKVDVLGTSTLHFRVLPHDLDVNVHMNNARYLALMDLGRIDLMMRCGLWRTVSVKKRQAIIGGALVRFRRPLKPFQLFTLSSRLLCWDERWLYIEHRIETKDAPACLTVVRGAFLDRGTIVPPAQLMTEHDVTIKALPVPTWIKEWNDAEHLAFTSEQPKIEAKEAI